MPDKTVTTENAFEVRLARLEKYLQREGHDITKYDGLLDGAYGSASSGDTGAEVRASAPTSKTTNGKWMGDFRFFKRDSAGGVSIIAYHPKNSLTWLWVFSYTPQSERGYPAKCGLVYFKEPLGQLKWCLSLSKFGMFNFHVQERMPYVSGI